MYLTFQNFLRSLPILIECMCVSLIDLGWQIYCLYSNSNYLFRSICPLAFFRCFISNSGVHTISRTEPLIWTTGYSKDTYLVMVNRIGTVYHSGSNKDSVWTPEIDMKHLKKAEGTIYQDMTQGQFLSGVEQVWIQSFPSPRLVASTRLKNLVRPTIYP